LVAIFMGAPSVNSASTIARYLAEREALTGSAKDSFLRILAEEFQYHDEAPSIAWRAWLFLAFSAGLVALAIDACLRNGSLPLLLWVGWPACSCAGVAIAFGLKNSDRDQRSTEFELQWRIYCLLVRPMILADNPGLLDRNLAVCRETVGELALTSLTSVQTVVKESRPKLLRSALVGLWFGMAVLLALRLSDHGQIGWTISLPVAGGVLGPLVWTSWQWVAFKVVSRDHRLEY
jgi:hypothetical protein